MIARVTLALVAVGLTALSAPTQGCDVRGECGDAVYPIVDAPQPGDSVLTRTEHGWFGLTSKVYFSESPVFFPERDFEVRDLEVGTGAAASTYRRMTFEVTAEGIDGTITGPERVTFVYPVPDGAAFRAVSIFGAVPERFLAGIAGMRVGGKREFTYDSPKEDLTNFFDGPSYRQVLRLPRGKTWHLQARLTAVCRPTVCRARHYTVPAMVSDKLIISSCD